MPEQPDHRIKRLEFAMDCADQATAFAARSRLFAMVDEVVPALDESLSAYAHDRRVHRIERVEIDLGRLTLERLDARRLRAALVEQLSRRLRELPPPPVDVPSAAQSLADTIAMFLTTGALPWQAAGRRLAELEAEARALAERDAAALVERLRPRFSAAECVRFVLQFSAAFVDWMIARLQGAPAVEVWARAQTVPTARAPGALVLRAAASLPAGATAAQFQAKVRQLSAASEPTPEHHAPGQESVRVRVTVPERDHAVSRAAIAAAPSETPSEALYVANAGVVLVHPFLARFFAHLGLVDARRQFVSPDAQERAVHLLHFLATGDEHAEEPTLVLHKLLCGMPVTRPVARARLDPAEKDEAERLLTAVIGHWTKLRATSPQGLRDAFLRRDGKLETQPAWVLTVEQRAIDVLLTHLPWMLSMVRLPWMARSLRVDWG